MASPRSAVALFALCAVVCAGLLVAPSAAQGPRPLIGVLSEPFNLTGLNEEYVVSSYVKWVQQGGARVVALSYTAPPHELTKRLDSLHGVVLPGGGGDIHPHANRYMNSTQFIFEYALRQQRAGRLFPVWGTCLGWEELAELASYAGASVLADSGSFDSEQVSLPLKFTEYGLHNSTMLSDLPPALKHALATQPLTYNAHHQGVTSEVFASHARLRSFWHLLATSVDLQGKEFVAAVEAKNYPAVFAVQFHPEKAQFEWSKGVAALDRVHTVQGVHFSQHLADKFMSFARADALAHPSSPDSDHWDIEFEGTRMVRGVGAMFFEVYLLPHHKPAAAAATTTSLRGAVAELE